MKGTIIYVQTKEYNDDGKVIPLPGREWNMRTTEPHYDEDLYDKYVMFPVNEDE